MLGGHQVGGTPGAALRRVSPRRGAPTCLPPRAPPWGDSASPSTFLFSRLSSFANLVAPLLFISRRCCLGQLLCLDPVFLGSLISDPLVAWHAGFLPAYWALVAACCSPALVARSLSFLFSAPFSPLPLLSPCLLAFPLLPQHRLLPCSSLFRPVPPTSSSVLCLLVCLPPPSLAPVKGR